METPSRHTYNLDGATRVFPVASPIKGDNYCRIEVDGTIINDRAKYDIVNNSIVFLDAADVPDGSQLDILVVQSEEAIGQLAITTNIDIVATNIDDINTVGTDIDAVVTVSGISTDVTSVAGNNPDISAVALNNPNVTAVAGNATNINAAVANATNINAAVANAANINAAVTNEANITAAVANTTNINAAVTNADDITTVATDLLDPTGSDIEAVVANETNINAAVANETNINAVAGNTANINAAVANETNINAAVANETNINAVVTNSTNINVVSGNTDNINTVAAADADIDAIIANMTAVQNAAQNAIDAQNAAASAAASYDSFDDRYLGAKSVEPTANNDGDPLISGNLYFHTGVGMKVYDGGSWIDASAASTQSMFTYEYTATASQTVFSGVDLDGQTLSYTPSNIRVYQNGIQLSTSDYTATDGSSVTLNAGAIVGDEVVVLAFASFTVADHYTKSESDGKYLTPTGDGSQLTGIDALPDQTGHTDQFLKTNGTVADWADVDAGAKGGSSDQVFWENDTNVTADYTITTGKNAMSAGPITVNTGITVSVPTGSEWTVV